METIEGYSILQWSIFFMSYCILGWVFESFYCSLKSGRLRNRGFCHGPWLPLYGSGATLLILLVWPYRDRHILVFLTGFFGGTALELFTGLLMEHLFNMRWWDYSHNPFNFHGYICLYAAIGWGVLALFITEFIHPHIERISRNWSYSTFLVVNTMLYTLFIEDAVASVFGALDLRDRLSRLAESSEEIQSLKLSIQEVYSRLETAKAGLNANAEYFREIQKSEGKMAAAKAVAGNTMGAAVSTVRAGLSAIGAKTGRGTSPEESQHSLKLQLEQMKARLSLLQDGGSDKSGRMSWWSKTMLRNNPEAVSGKSSFADLKEVAMRGKHRKGKEAGGENLSGQEYADIRLYGKTDGGKLGDSEDV